LPILVDFLRFSFRSDWTVNWFAAVIAILEAVLFWVLAAGVFNRRDIAIPVE
jgi:ABC-type transport system involved in multi-copper enzyme maturation permease subunit